MGMQLINFNVDSRIFFFEVSEVLIFPLNPFTKNINAFRLSAGQFSFEKSVSQYHFDASSNLVGFLKMVLNHNGRLNTPSVYQSSYVL